MKMIRLRIMTFFSNGNYTFTRNDFFQTTGLTIIMLENEEDVSCTIIYFDPKL